MYDHVFLLGCDTDGYLPTFPHGVENPDQHSRLHRREKLKYFNLRSANFILSLFVLHTYTDTDTDTHTHTHTQPDCTAL
jgi:hypothetical protein